MTSTTFPAAKLRLQQRIELAIAAMAGSANISRLSSELEGVALAAGAVARYPRLRRAP